MLVEPGIRRRLPELLRRHAPAFRYAVISDDNVAPLYGEEVVAGCRVAGLDATLFTFPAGEAHKTRKQWSILTDALLARGMGRDCAVVAVGGGVTGDLAGFVAATLHRGIPVVQVPTSLVAMIDASVGGKTGVDVKSGKNLVGAFHPPRAVVADPETASTLPRRERAQGLAEAVKHGAIADALYLESLEADADALLDGEVGAVQAAVARSVALKARVVGEDEREAGLREILNFGHTYGHALEAASGFDLGHGSAVALGMLLEARLGERIGITESGTEARIRAALDRLGLARVALPTRDAAAVLGFLGADKKVRAGVPRFVLLRRAGEVARGEGWTHAVDAEVVEQVLSTALAGGSGGLGRA
ncbi:MAG: 3-dehydroquinate synthase [Gemmatimonadota bacterium]